MKSLSYTPLVCIIAAAAAVFLDLPYAIKLITVLPGLFIAPGWAWARRINASSSWLLTTVHAAWISIALTVISVTLVRHLGGGVLTMFTATILFALYGELLAQKVTRQDLLPISRSGGPIAGIFALLILVIGMALGSNLNQPLERWWYNAEAMGEWEPGATILLPEVSEESGWTKARYLGEYENSNTPIYLESEDNSGGKLSGIEFDNGQGVIWVAAIGDIGMELSVTSFYEGEPNSTTSSSVESDVTEELEEGPVPRYLSRGVAAVPIRGPAEEVIVQTSGAGEGSSIILMPGTDGIWGADHLGELHFVHYYQILNIVENQRWASELYDERLLTINQPPLWSYVLAVPTLLVDSDLPGANGMFLFVVLLVGLTALSVIETIAPSAPTTAWLIPGVYAAVHFKLMFDPGSTNFPDSLYSAALLGGVGALFRASKSGQGRAWVVCFAMAAGALRYPGVVITTLAGVLMWLIAKRSAWGALRALWVWVVLLGTLVFVGAWFLGHLDHLVFTLWFETGPEHYHGDYSLTSILPRVPEFFYKWSTYLGFGSSSVIGPIIALSAAAWLIAANKTSRWLIVTALCYGALLSTIDHSPTHYFLPLIGLSGLSVVAAASTLTGKLARLSIPAAFVLSGLLFLVTGRV